MAKAHEIQKKIKENTEIKSTVSIGCTLSSEKDTTIDNLSSRCDIPKLLGNASFEL